MFSARVLSRSAKKLTWHKQYSFVVRQDLWTPNNVVTSPFEDIVIPNSTLPEHVWRNIEKWSDKPALTCGLTNRFYTYSELYKYSRTFAANLRTKYGINDGDVVCVMLQNSPEYGLVALGTMEAGAEMTTVNPIYTAHELQRQIELAKPKVMIGSTETVKVIKKALKLSKKTIPIITVQTLGQDLPTGTADFLELAKDPDVNTDVLKDVKRKSEDVVALPYSSGTTGLPKGVELTHRNLVVNCIQQDVDGVKHYKDTTASNQDAVMAVLPFYHIYGFVIVLMHKLSVGANVVALPKFEPNSFLSTMKDHKINLLYTAPPILLFLGKHPSSKKEHLETVQNVLCGAAPCHKEDIHQVMEKLQPNSHFIQLYGLTESSPLATSNVPDNTNLTSAGYAISNTEMSIVDSELNRLGPSKIGELCLRGPHIMKGYRNNPEATKNTITEDGWLRTGDLASIDKDGSVTIVDRLKELIKVKGFQVAPAELENILKEHPAVLDAGVVGIPDERAGEVPKAFIVLKDRHKANDEDIKDFVKERVAEFKRIKHVEFLDALPKNPSGKLLRRVLKEEYI